MSSTSAHILAREAQELERATVLVEIPPREPACVLQKHDGSSALQAKTTAKSKTDVYRISRRGFTVRA